MKGPIQKTRNSFGASVRSTHRFRLSALTGEIFYWVHLITSQQFPIKLGSSKLTKPGKAPVHIPDNFLSSGMIRGRTVSIYLIYCSETVGRNCA